MDLKFIAGTVWRALERRVGEAPGGRLPNRCGRAAVLSRYLRLWDNAAWCHEASLGAARVTPICEFHTSLFADGSGCVMNWSSVRELSTMMAANLLRIPPAGGLTGVSRAFFDRLHRMSSDHSPPWRSRHVIEGLRGLLADSKFSCGSRRMVWVATRTSAFTR